jgi:hypothetical protein
MRETADARAPAVVIELPAQALNGFVETRSATGLRSTVVWGEHCTECAFPACYSACSFYSPRADHHCRRFENGIERARCRSAPQLDLTRIAFRRWGKLEGRGRITLSVAGDAARLERLDRSIDGLLSGPLPGAALDKLGWRLNEVKRQVGGRGEAISPDDVFVLEAWHEGAETWPFTLSIMTGEKETSGLYQAAV